MRTFIVEYIDAPSTGKVVYQFATEAESLAKALASARARLSRHPQARDYRVYDPQAQTYHSSKYGE